jgi:hypothetical protein
MDKIMSDDVLVSACSLDPENYIMSLSKCCSCDYLRNYCASSHLINRFFVKSLLEKTFPEEYAKDLLKNLYNDLVKIFGEGRDKYVFYEILYSRASKKIYLIDHKIYIIDSYESFNDTILEEVSRIRNLSQILSKDLDVELGIFATKDLIFHGIIYPFNIITDEKDHFIIEMFHKTSKDYSAKYYVSKGSFEVIEYFVDPRLLKKTDSSLEFIDMIIKKVILLKKFFEECQRDHSYDMIFWYYSECLSKPLIYGVLNFNI